MIHRKSAYGLTPQEQQDYIDGVTAMIASGEYADLVNAHTDMRHNMHTMNGVIGTRRFLTWHRDFVLQMERKLRGHKGNAFVPYLNWPSGGVPAWLASFKPTVTGVKDPGGFGIPPTVTNNRTNRTTSFWPQSDLDTILKNTDYDSFTTALEAGPHNHIHNMLGSPMTGLQSPCDPIFWMHHGMVDNLWAQWQAKNPGKGPILTGKDAQMDPWMSPDDTVSKLDSISNLGYDYV
jgi:tyrosinase